MPHELNYAALDPGIRETVRWLNDLGYTTSDSGDGVSKPHVARVFDFPHVYVHLDIKHKDRIAHNAHLIMKALEEKGIECDGREVEVEGVYLAGQQSASIFVRGVNDAMLSEKERSSR